MKKAPWLIFFLCVTIFLEAQTVSTTINSNRLNQNQQTKTTTTNNYSNQTKSNLETENLSDTLSANQAATVITNRTLAVASADYKVCAGDTFLLAYSAAGTLVEYPIQLDASYMLRISNLGNVDVRGKTFLQVKKIVEDLITKNYPFSGVQFTLTAPAQFYVTVKGEVIAAQEVATWGMARLDSVIKNMLTAYSSTRDIVITSATGETKTYDLFKAVRDGDLSQNPYMSPGDVITIRRLSRSCTITGAVERPGTYELLEGESLSDLIFYYGGGFAENADRKSISVTRHPNTSVVGEIPDSVFYLDFTKFAEAQQSYELQHLDEVEVSSIVRLQPVLFIEGAVFEVEKQDDDSTVEQTYQPGSSNRITMFFTEGEDYATIIRRVSDIFLETADTPKAYIVRQGESIPLNIDNILYDKEYLSGILAKSYDTVIVPFRLFFVNVAGAVNIPGRYPYIPDRTWDYYIGLAGGFDQDKNSHQKIEIVGSDGTIYTKNDYILPEVTITAKTNSFLYYFNKYAVPVTTTLSIVSTLLMFYNTVK